MFCSSVRDQSCTDILDLFHRLRSEVSSGGELEVSDPDPPTSSAPQFVTLHSPVGGVVSCSLTLTLTHFLTLFLSLCNSGSGWCNWFRLSGWCNSGWCNCVSVRLQVADVDVDSDTPGTSSGNRVRDSVMMKGGPVFNTASIFTTAASNQPVCWCLLVTNLVTNQRIGVS